MDEQFDARLPQISDLISEGMGLHFPKERYIELERRIRYAAQQFGFAEHESFFRWLLSSPLTQNQIEILASHLTVGETYFFRETKLFEELENHVIPALIQDRQSTSRSLRIWSAGCCTGEEAYSIAILLSRLISNWAEWNITLLATDINPLFLQKALRGIYGKWSFRQAGDIKTAHYFERRGDNQYEILASIKNRVSFSYFNLVKDRYPSLTNNTTAIDIIFCRNVLMYFTPEKAKEVVQNFYNSLIEGGWLIVSPCELSPVLFHQFQTVHFQDVILYRKDSHQPCVAEWIPCPQLEDSKENIPFPWIDSDFSREALVEETEKQEIPFVDYGNNGRFFPRDEQPNQHSDETKSSTPFPPNERNSAEIAMQARTCANQGNLSEAQVLCEQAIQADRLNPSLQYLHATILQELGKLEECKAALHRTLYLDPHFILAYFSLGNLALQQGFLQKSKKYLENVLSLLQKHPSDTLLPESDGMTAGRMIEIVRSTLEMETIR